MAGASAAAVGIGHANTVAADAPDLAAGPFGPEYPLGTPPSNSVVGGDEGYKHTYEPSDADVVVDNRQSLLLALDDAGSGDVVYVDDGAEIDLTDDLPVEIPGGVTLASGRGVDGSGGALLYSEDHHFHDVDFREEAVLLLPDDQSAVAGIRLRGPSQYHFQFEGANRSYKNKSRSQGIRIEGDFGEIHNCEIYGFPNIAVYCFGAYTHVHHNYVHSNAQRDLGYGVYANSVDGPVKVEYNYFDWNRHDIASKGVPDSRFGQTDKYPSYVARFNVSGPNYISAPFDVHGENEGRDSSGNCVEPYTSAGKNTWVYLNTFEGELVSHPDRIGGPGGNNPGTTFVLRGVPEGHAWFQNNWVHQTTHGLPNQGPQNCRYGTAYDDSIDFTVENNARGQARPSHLTVGAPVERDFFGIRNLNVNDDLSYQFTVDGDAERITDVARPHTDDAGDASVVADGDVVTVTGTTADEHHEWIVDGEILLYEDDGDDAKSLVLNGQRVSEADLNLDGGGNNTNGDAKYEDFGSSAPGTEPDGWSSPTGSAFEVVESSGRPGGTEVELRSEPNEPHILAWRDAGTFADGEIAAVFDATTATTNDLRLFLRCQNGGDDAYFLEPRPADGEIYISRYADGGYSILEQPSLDLDETDERLHARFQVDGDQLRGKAWNSTDEEPDDWLVETTTTDVTGAGHPAIGTYDGPGERWSAVGVHSGSGDAPLPADRSDEVVVDVGSTTIGDGSPTAPVSITSAPNGLSGYRFDLSVDETVATIADVAFPDALDALNEVTIADDGSSATVEAVDTDGEIDPGTIDAELLSVVLAGASEGSTSLEITVDRLEDDDGTPLEADVDGGTVTVADQLPPVCGDGDPPQDRSGDGLYRDVDGDGDATFADVKEFYECHDHGSVQNNPAAYDFAGTGDVSYVDVIELFGDVA